MNKKYKFWKYVNALSKKGMKENYLKPHGGCDSCCPRCRIWESEGNTIYTAENDDNSDTRECSTCAYKWKAIFTPAGFMPIKEKGIKYFEVAEPLFNFECKWGVYLKNGTTSICYTTNKDYAEIIAQALDEFKKTGKLDKILNNKD
jgi:hypothetical protein